jgi:hypothetical protein
MSKQQIRAGQIVLFKGKGLVFSILSLLIAIVDSNWRGRKWKPWHCGILWRKDTGGWYVFEGYAPRSRLHFYANADLKDARFYNWVPFYPKAEVFLETHIDKPYDVAIYFWTGVQYLIRHYLNHRIPRLLDDRYTCWELISEYASFMGKPVQSRFDCPMIPDILKAIEKKERNH